MKNIFETIGFINEDYFMYVEDLEFTQRVINYGYKIAIADKSHILHKVGSSTGGRYSTLSVYWRTKNMIKFLNEYKTNYLTFIFLSSLINIKLLLNLIRHKKISLIKTQVKAIISEIY